MTWNYRIIRRVDSEERESFSVHRVYYKDDRVFTVEETPSCPSEESIGALDEEFRRMKEAFQKPVLNYGDI